MLHLKVSFGAVAAGVLVATTVPTAVPAVAADLAAPYLGSQQFPEDKVEFGSGWYIRGDLGVTRNQRIGAASVPTFDNTNAGANPQAPGLALSPSHTLGYDASIGGGYQFNHWLRTDLIADFHQPIQASGTTNYTGCPNFTDVNGVRQTEACYANTHGSMHSFDVLANAYVDIGTWYGVTPYVGAGVGLAFGRYQSSSQWFQGNATAFTRQYTDLNPADAGATFLLNWDRSASTQFYNLAWALMGGFSIDVFDHTKLDVGYRYLNLGKINTTVGSLNLTSQEIRAGLRYMIDN